MIDLHENIEYFILEDQWEVKIKRQNLSISLIYLNGGLEFGGTALRITICQMLNQDKI